ncbi:ATP-binding cassette domain-containing protein [Caulobacter sp. NIBR1757]|uniref:ATP-binding cassette domain-containing protein n=1 Tax=Caulobacter sp. NIBR1757 TaxID=3016000 RepID=UPI0022F11796|nr:ATP-binding cassette domain-containing protein [Caulobacter sp. NIBR1757]WGM37655.1 Vitamin B12 import ATP-binding protein BtuD [Caulobacter sp. NIBR1757]
MTVPKGGVDRLLRQERRRQGQALLIAAACAGAAAAAGVGLLGLSGWFLAGAALAGAAGPAATQAFNYLLPSAAIRLMAILRTAGRYGERLAGHTAGLRAGAALRAGLFARLTGAPPSHSLSLVSGDAISRLTEDVSQVEGGMIEDAGLWGAAAGAVACLGLIAIASPVAALAAALVLAAQVWSGRRLAARARGLARARLAASSALRGGMTRWLTMDQEVRALGVAEIARTDLRRLEDLRAEQEYAGWRQQAALTGLLAVSTAVCVGLVAVLSADAGPALMALAVLAAAAGAEAGGGMLRALDRAASAREAALRLDQAFPDPVVGPAPPPLRGQSLSLRIAGAEAALQRTDRLLLTGPSGSGKTTVLHRLVGLAPCREGEIWIDGVDLHALPAGCARALFSLAAQDAPLLSGTVRDNLTLGRRLPDDALWSALHTACLDTRVQSLPLGLDCWLGDGGVALSGGERRRLSVARALLRPSPWLLLDEPTEGLDADVEAEIVRRLDERLRLEERGLILVSHRPAPRALTRAQLQTAMPIERTFAEHPLLTEVQI